MAYIETGKYERISPIGECGQIGYTNVDGSGNVYMCDSCRNRSKKQHTYGQMLFASPSFVQQQKEKVNILFKSVFVKT